MKAITYIKLRVAEYSLDRIQSELAAARDYERELELECMEAGWHMAALAQEMREVGMKIVALEEEQDYLVARISTLKTSF